MMRHNKTGNHTGQNKQSLKQQSFIRNGICRIHRHDFFLAFIGRMHLHTPKTIKDENNHKHCYQNNRRQNFYKIHKSQIKGRTDKNIGRITDKCSRTADI